LSFGNCSVSTRSLASHDHCRYAKHINYIFILKKSVKAMSLWSVVVDREMLLTKCHGVSQRGNTAEFKLR